MRKIIITLLSLLIAATLAGCGQSGSSGPTSKVTQENYDKLKEGMTLAEATAILGEPTVSQDVQVSNTHIKAVIWEGSIKIGASFDSKGILLAKRIAP